MKTSELIRAELDYWVAKTECLDVCNCHGLTPGEIGFMNERETRRCTRCKKDWPDKYSTNWQQGGPLIEKYEISLFIDRHHKLWHAGLSETQAHKSRMLKDIYEGETPLIAAMRCFVASKFGDEVSDD